MIWSGKSRELEGVAMQFDSQKWFRVIQGFPEETEITWKIVLRQRELKNK